MSATHPAFFMGRAEILGWINDTLGTRVAKIEDTCNGSIACQLMDALHPGVVPMKKVDFNAKNEYDMINNYKVLQDVFTKMNVDKYIEVAKLIKGKPLDNTEFLQWFKMYFDGVTNGQAITDYDGTGRRAASKSGDLKGGSGPAPALHKVKVSAPAPTRKPLAPVRSPPQNKTEGRSSLAEERARADALEQEKQFYWSKLRDIELLAQTPSLCDIPVMKKVEAILYAATAEEGRQLLIAAQQELVGAVFLDEGDAPAE